MIAAGALVFAACSLDGEGTGGQFTSDDDPDVDAPVGSRRDGGLDGSLDARVEDARVTPLDPPQDAFVPVRDAALDARAPTDARVDAGDAGPVCSPPGVYAVLVDFNVEWIPTTLAGVLPVLEGGQGSIRMFATVRLEPSGEAVVKPCGTTVPDFEGTQLVGGELYGGDIPVAAWDAPTMPSFESGWSTLCNRPGCGYLGEQATFVIGARPLYEGAPWPPQGGWVAAGEYEATDDDSDGRPGLTMITRGPPMTNADGRAYAYPPVGLASYGRARKLWLAMQLRVKLTGTLQTCDLISGSSSDAEAHVSAVGCTGVLDGTTEELSCSPDVTQFVDANLPMWTVHAATFKMVRMPANGSCYTARALLAP